MQPATRANPVEVGKLGLGEEVLGAEIESAEIHLFALLDSDRDEACGELTAKRASPEHSRCLESESPKYLFRVGSEKGDKDGILQRPQCGETRTLDTLHEHVGGKRLCARPG